MMLRMPPHRRVRLVCPEPKDGAGGKGVNVHRPARAVRSAGLALLVVLGLGVLPVQTLATSAPSPTAGTRSPVAQPDLVAPVTVPSGGAPAFEQFDPAHAPAKSPDKLDGILGQIAVAARSGGAISALSAARVAGVRVRDEGVQVVIVAQDGNGAALAPLIQAAGGTPQLSSDELLQALLPVDSLERIAALPEVRYLRLPYPAVAQEVITEGRAIMGMQPWDQLGIRGKGARVGVLDLGFANADALAGNELPRQMPNKSFRDDQDLSGAGNDHGTAVAEVVHDIAPDADIYLANFTTEVEFNNATNWMIDQGVHIIVSSVGWPATAAGDGTGSINNAVRRARERGIVWVQAAGNFAQTHWAGQFADPDGNNFHNFRPTDEGETIVLPVGSGERIFKVDITLTWDDWTCWCQDFDLYLLRGDAVVAQSTAWQNGNFPPVERVSYTTPTTGQYWIAIQRFRASRRVNFDLYTTTDYNLEFRTPQSSLAIPADSPFAITVGAVATDGVSVRAYSSRGPTKDGRPKPDLVAPDGVSTATYGPRFEGTSASAPHVGGALALMKSQRPSLTASQLEQLLLSRVVGGTGQRDLTFGLGRLWMGTPLPGVFLPFVTRGGQQ
jgi:hypothetical protein